MRKQFTIAIGVVIVVVFVDALAGLNTSVALAGESALRKVWNIVAYKKAASYPVFQIPSANVIDLKPPGTKMDTFSTDASYFEIRISEQFLRHRRKYWKEFNPTTVIQGEFIYGHERVSVPFILGPTLLANIPQIEEGDTIRFLNTPVLGPTPYRGGDVSLFIAFFRVTIKNWATEALSLLEGVAKTFDQTQLSKRVEISDALVKGLQSFMGLGDDMQLRFGMQVTFSDPANSSAKNFSPGYFVLLRDDKESFDKDKSWVKNGELFVGADAENLEPYRENDFILYQIVRLERRGDENLLEFNKLWFNVKEKMADQDIIGAKKIFARVLYSIATSPDLTDSHRKMLIVQYRRMFNNLDVLHNQKEEPDKLISELRSNNFDKIVEYMTSVGVDAETIQAITKNRDYFLEATDFSDITADQVDAVFDNKVLNTPSLKSVDSLKLANALSS